MEKEARTKHQDLKKTVQKSLKAKQQIQKKES